MAIAIGLIPTRSTADDARSSGVRRSGRFDVLWTERPGLVPARAQQSERGCGASAVVAQAASVRLYGRRPY